MTTKVFPSSKLIDSIRAGRLTGVVMALDDGADIEEADMHGSRGLPLRAACFEGNLAVVRELLQRGANPNASASDGPSAPLRLALRRGHNDVAALLLQQGAEVPPGLIIDPSVFDVEVSPLVTDASPPPMLPDNIIEFTPTQLKLATNDTDQSEEFGTDTKALSMDLLFLDEPIEQHPSESLTEALTPRRD